MEKFIVIKDKDGVPVLLNIESIAFLMPCSATFIWGGTIEITEESFFKIASMMVLDDEDCKLLQMERLSMIEKKVDLNIAQRDDEPLVKLKKEAILKKKIDTMPLRSYTQTRLRNSGIITIGDLCNKSVIDLISIKNLGWKAVTEIEDYLRSNNLSLKVI